MQAGNRPNPSKAEQTEATGRGSLVKDTHEQKLYSSRELGSDAVWVAAPRALEQLVAALLNEPIIGVDTESNSLYAFREQVCLIQFSTPERDYLVDPLILIDVSPLGKVLADPKIEKVFHAAEYDIICLKRDFGFEFANLFDTMVAARILGRKEVGLGAMLMAEFGVKLDKRFQRANWGQRPLPVELIDYARLDTHYLIPLRARLKVALEALGRWPLACEDFRRLCALNGHFPEDGPEACWGVNGAYDLTPQKAAVLQAVCEYRTDVARNLDRPLFKVLGDETILSIAAACPTRLDELRKLPGMSDRQIQRHGRALLAVVQRGLHAPPIHPPRPSRPDEQFLGRVDALKEWRKETARRLGVESDVVLPRNLLYEIAEQNPGQPKDLAALLNGVPWRLEHFGSQILQALQR
jgi:ribonuclease D